MESRGQDTSNIIYDSYKYFRNKKTQVHRLLDVQYIIKLNALLK